MLIIHGEDQIASRQVFLAKKQNQTVRELNGEDSILSDVINSTQGESLFGGEALVFIENLFSSRPSARKTEIVNFFQENQDLDVFIWESKDVSSQLKSFPANIVQKFDLPKIIFAFMDHPTIELLHKCLASMPVEQIFASLVTRLYKQEKTQDLLKLLEIDYKSKTSQLPYDLTTGLELFLLNKDLG